MKEEACEEITDHESESTSSMHDVVFNSSQQQRTSTISQRIPVSQTRNNSNNPDNGNTSASKMCVICGNYPVLLDRMFAELEINYYFQA